MHPQQIDSSGSAGVPTEKNPLLVAFEKFQSQTPAFTRTTIYFLASSWVLCWFLPFLVLDCTWVFLEQRFEIYRIFTSICVNPDLFSNLLAGFLLVQFVQRLEVASGSAAMVWWSVVVFTLGTNSIFLFLQAMLIGFSILPSAAVWTSAGMWNVVLGLLAMEACRSAPTQPTRKFCSFWNIPTKYHPLAYLVLVGFMGKSPVAMSISTALGYVMGMDASVCAMPLAVKLAIDRYGRSAAGWLEQGSGIVAAPLEGESESLLPTMSNQQETVIPSSSGQALGGASFRNADTRAARLQALERNGRGSP